MTRHEQQRTIGLRLRSPIFLLIVLLAGVALALSGNWAAAEVAPEARRGAASLVGAGGPRVSLDPSAVQLVPGTSQTFDVVISDVVDLYGFEIHMGFDPAVIQVTDLDYGGFLSPDIVAQFSYDNATGRINVGISQKSPDSQPRSGSGTLVTIDLNAVAPGNAEFTFIEVLLSNHNGISLAGSASQPDVMVLQVSATLSHTPTSTLTATPSATPSPTATINPQATPYFYLEPQSLSVEVGQTKAMQLRTSYVEGLGGVGVRLRWDPSKVQVVDALLDVPGVQVAPGDLFEGHAVLQPVNGNTVDNATGELSYSLVYLDSAPGVDGEWIVATISFTGMLTGTTIVEFYGPDTLMTDADGLSLPSSWINGQITVGSAVGPTPTATASPEATATPTVAVVCSDRIQNGGFEQGGQNWTTQAATTFDGIPHGGTVSAYLGGYDGATDGIYQSVTIPANATSAALNYWWYMFTTKSEHPNDYLYVEIYDGSGVLQEELATMSDGSVANQWQQGTHSLMDYAGETIRVSFRVTTETGASPAYTSFYVDDVAVQVCAPDEEPTPSGSVVLPLIMDNYVKPSVAQAR